MKVCPPDHKHAETTTCRSNHGCGCTPCRERLIGVQRNWRRQQAYGRPLPKSVIPSTGTRRRLEALAARGYSLATLGRELGVTIQAVHQMMGRDNTQRQSAEKVAALYERLWNVPPPRSTRYERMAYTRAIDYAEARGFVPPAAWDDIDLDPEPPRPDDEDAGGIDHVTVELAVMGRRPRMSQAERDEAIIRLHVRQWSDARVGQFLGCAGKTVLEARTRLGIAAWPQNDLADVSEWAA